MVPDDGVGKPENWNDAKRLLLVVEALSPSTAHADRFEKRRLYQQQGIPEYWIVDTDARIIDRWRPGDERPEMIGDVIEWQARAEVTALRIVLDEIFGSPTAPPV